jgi:hypothetical protein
MKSSAENKLLLFGLTQAEFLNFTNYFVFGNLSNLKIWRLSKNAQTLVLAKTCAIFYIQCCEQCFFHSDIILIFLISQTSLKSFSLKVTTKSILIFISFIISLMIESTNDI